MQLGCKSDLVAFLEVYMQEALLEALIDSIKLIPFLFVTYLAMGMLERAGSGRAQEMIRSAGHVGPVIGGLIGAIPQCGFSAAASYFYVGKIITLGTLIAVYLSTSDEMIPIFLSAHVPAEVIGKILAAKVIIAVISGFVVEIFFGWLAKRRHVPDSFRDEKKESCNCAGSLLVDSVVKTLQVFFFILVVSVIISVAMELAGHQAITGLFQGVPVLGEMIAALIGLIPNCAASVVITQLYLEGVINAGTMMSGLLSSAGVGLLVLVREMHNTRRSLSLIVMLYVVSAFWGILINALGVTF